MLFIPSSKIDQKGDWHHSEMVPVPFQRQVVMTWPPRRVLVQIGGGGKCGGGRPCVADRPGAALRPALETAKTPPPEATTPPPQTKTNTTPLKRQIPKTIPP